MRDYTRKKEYNEVKEKHLEKLKIFLKKQDEYINKGKNRT